MFAASLRRRPRAFSLVEIMVAITIIGILASLALPAFKKIVLQSRGSALLNDLRVFAGGYAQYAHSNGSYPASYTTAGGFPATMAGIITPAQWIRETPIGGYYAFLKDNTVGGTQYRALLQVSTSGGSTITFTAPDLLRLDQKSDDGDTATGQFFTNGAALNTYYVIEK